MFGGFMWKINVVVIIYIFVVAAIYEELNPLLLDP